MASGKKYTDMLNLTLQGRLSETQRSILETVKRAPAGISRRDLVKASGRALTTVEQYLCALRTAGLVESTGVGAYSVWTTPDRVDEVRAMATSRFGLMTDEKRRRLSAQKLAQRQRARERRDREVEVQTVRVVPANGAQMMRPQGPVSVFHLGAML